MYPPRNLIRRTPGGPGPAPAQVAAGEAMLADAAANETPALRWYSFEPAALLLGSGQRPSDVDYEACARDGIPVHRRGSGGGAVLGRSLLLLDLTLPRGHHLFRADVTESYRWLGQAWRDALRALGLPAATIGIEAAREDARRLDPLLRRVCFGGVSPYEVLVGQRKLVGLAQRRRYGGALFQAAVYLDWEPASTAALIAASPAEREWLAEQLQRRVAGLDAFAATAGLHAHDVVTAVEDALRAAGSFEIVEAAPASPVQAARPIRPTVR